MFGKRVKEHNSHVTSIVYEHTVSNNHHQANISYFEIIDQDIKQVAKEGIVSIRISNTALNHNTGKNYITEILNHLPAADKSSDDLDQEVD